VSELPATSPLTHCPILLPLSPALTQALPELGIGIQAPRLTGCMHASGADVWCPPDGADGEVAIGATGRGAAGVDECNEGVG